MKLNIIKFQKQINIFKNLKIQKKNVNQNPG